MITFTDRIPAEGKENRYKITKSDGSIEYIKLERADDANPIGTPLNKVTFESLQKEVMPVVGTYTGTASMQTVNLGFTPKVVIIFENSESVSYQYNSIVLSNLPEIKVNNIAEIVNNGFKIYGTTDGKLNDNGHTYSYVAFRG